MNRTISHLYADMDRANQQGAKSISINLLDLKEILGLADSAAMRATAENAKKHAGWVRPGGVLALRTGKKAFVSVSRRRSDEFCLELFYGGDLHEHLPKANEVAE